MYVEAYELIHEILEDEELNKHVKETTGKRLAIVDSGPVATVPAASITFVGGAVNRSENTLQHTDYTVTFSMPYWGADGMKKCHKLLDVAIEAFFAHELREPSGRGQRRNYVLTVSPTLTEEDPEKKLWTVGLLVTVSIFRDEF